MRSNGSKIVQICGTLAVVLTGITFLTFSTDMLSAAPQTQTGEPLVRFTATTKNILDSQDAVRIDLIGWSSDAERDQLAAAWTQALARAVATASVQKVAGIQGGKDARVAQDALQNSKGAPPTRRPESSPVAPPASLTPRGSLYAALEKSPTLGYIWSSSEISGYAVRYAVQLPQPGGGARVILITDRRLGDQDDRWKLVGSTVTSKEPAAGTPGDYDTGSDGRPNQYDEFSLIELRLNSKGQGEGKISMDYQVAVDGDAKVLELPHYEDTPVVLGNVHRKDFDSKRKES